LDYGSKTHQCSKSASMAYGYFLDCTKANHHFKEIAPAK